MSVAADISGQQPPDAPDSEAREPFDLRTLSGQQRALYTTLEQKNQKLARIYLGSLIATRDLRNPDRFAQSAHGLRELMEKIPEIINVPIKAQRESLNSKMRGLESSWETMTENTACFYNAEWRGEIDGPLRKFLRRSGAFFQWFRDHMPRRREEFLATLRGLEDSGRRLPNLLEEKNVEIWNMIREFFQSVAHHGREVNNSDFGDWLDALEIFLLDRLRPRTFADFDEIDRAIEKGGRDA